jgi:F420-dependent oxidoreductase-like protein
MAQAFDVDALTALAVVGSMVPRLPFGTHVVPMQPRHPMVLAAQALTVQAAIDNRLTLGIGLSHQSTVERVWGLRYERPVAYLREYLTILRGVLHEGISRLDGDLVSARTITPVRVPKALAPDILVGALAPQTLRVAGELAEGTIVTFTGPRTLASMIVPSITAAAATAGRPPPRIVAALPICVTDQPDKVRADIAREYGFVERLPSYRAVLDREGVSSAVDVAAVGTERAVAQRLRDFLDAGATELSPFIVGPERERHRAIAVLSDLARTA